MQSVLKTFWADTKSIDPEQHIVQAVVSTETPDRDGDIVLASAFKKRLSIYRKHPILMASHRHTDLRAQIGEALDIRANDKGLTARFKYYFGEGNEEADWAYNIASKGRAAYSIGFIPHTYQDLNPETNKEARRQFTDIELVEISQVCVPANLEALTSCLDSEDQIESELAGIAIKMFEAQEKKELEKLFVTKPEPEVTENYIRIRVRDPGDFRDDSFRTVWISRSQGIKAVMGKLKKPPEGHEGSMVVQSYLFDKDKYTLAEAQAWVREHKDTISEEMLLVRQLSQSPDFYDLITRIVDEHEKSYIENLLSKVDIKSEPQDKADIPDMESLKNTIRQAVSDALAANRS